MKNSELPQIQVLTSRVVLVSWAYPIEEEFLYYLIGVKKALKKAFVADKVEILNTYNALLLKFSEIQPDMEATKDKISRTIAENREVDRPETTRIFTLPVCYDEEFGLDLDEVSHSLQLSKKEVIHLHSQAIYTVYFIGFLPGFLYLGGLDGRLKMARKTEPRLNLPRGAVGIAEDQTGIYPQNSAGGWQILGNCPVPLFQARQNPPSVFRSGDKLKFTSVSRSEYERIKEQAEKGNYPLLPKTFKL